MSNTGTCSLSGLVRHLRQRISCLPTSLEALSQCSVKTQGQTLVLHSKAMIVLAELFSPETSFLLLQGADEKGFSAIEYQFNGEVIRTMTNDSLSPLIPLEISRSLHRLDAWVTGHEESVAFVLGKTWMTCSEEFCRVTKRSLLEWRSAWQYVDGKIVHENDLNHLKGGADNLQRLLSKTKFGVLPDHRWKAFFAVTGEEREFHGSFQRVTFDGLEGRVLFLHGEPELCAQQSVEASYLEGDQS